MSITKVRLFWFNLDRISSIIEYSLSKQRRHFLLLTGIFFISIFLLFMAAAWLSISSTRGEFGHPPVGVYPNYFDFTPENIANTISYWRSPAYGLIEKMEFLLNTTILICGSYNPETNVVSGAFQVGLGQLICIVSMAFLMSMYTNLWLLSRRNGYRISAVAIGTGFLAASGGGASSIFSMLLLAGSDGGTGASTLFFSLPIIGQLFSGLYAKFDTMSVLLIVIPANLLLTGMIVFLASKFRGIPTAESKTTKEFNDWLKIVAYLIVAIIFLFTFAIAVYWWYFQSIVVINSGLTGGVQNATVAIYTTLPLSASLFLMSAYTHLRWTFRQRKLLKISG